MKTIDITPTWEGIMPALLRALAHNPNNRAIEEEILRCARIADEAIAKAKEAHAKMVQDGLQND